MNREIKNAFRVDWSFGGIDNECECVCVCMCVFAA